MNIRDRVLNYPTKHKEGFLHSEAEALAKEFPNINMDKFYSALEGNTGIMIGDEGIRYLGDVLKAIQCGIENRNLKSIEWD